MKDFRDFLEHIDQKKLTDESSKILQDYIDEGINHENFCSMLVSSAIAVSIRLLHDYHEWNNQ